MVPQRPLRRSNLRGRDQVHHVRRIRRAFKETRGCLLTVLRCKFGLEIAMLVSRNPFDALRNFKDWVEPRPSLS